MLEIKTVTVKQIQKLDRIAIEQYGVPSLVLMENAGRSVAQEVLMMVRRVKNPYVVIVCGTGNNAGDGFVAARHLINAGIKISIWTVRKAVTLKNDAAVNYQILRKLKIPVKEIGVSTISFARDLRAADLVVDAIFGVGLNREVGEPYRTVIETVNREARKVLAVDIPSGLDGTTGKVYGICTQANRTVTFSCLKKGMLKGAGSKYAGKISVADIGIPKPLVTRLNS